MKTHFICVCKRTAHFPSTLTHFPSGKAGMSAFRHIRRDAENASKSVRLHWQIFCLAGNVRLKCATVNEAIMPIILNRRTFFKNSFSIIIAFWWNWVVILWFKFQLPSASAGDGRCDIRCQNSAPPKKIRFSLPAHVKLWKEFSINFLFVFLKNENFAAIHSSLRRL